jgi:hypothetical protein
VLSKRPVANPLSSTPFTSFALIIPAPEKVNEPFVPTTSAPVFVPGRMPLNSVFAVGTHGPKAFVVDDQQITCPLENPLAMICETLIVVTGTKGLGTIICENVTGEPDTGIERYIVN